MALDKRDQKLLNRIYAVRGVLLCLNAITWIISIAIIALCFWIRFDNDIQDWVNKLDIQSFNVGIYMLIISSFLIFVVAFISCGAILSENRLLMFVNIAMQLLIFVVGLAGAAVLMSFSTYRSAIHPVIRAAMLKLITLSPYDNFVSLSLATIQENIGCCGGDGVDDYFNIRRAIPPECRDGVTGNIYYYGCADELTWFLEQRTEWITFLVFLMCSQKVVNATLSFVLVQLMDREEP